MLLVGKSYLRNARIGVRLWRMLSFLRMRMHRHVQFVAVQHVVDVQEIAVQTMFQPVINFSVAPMDRSNSARQIHRQPYMGQDANRVGFQPQRLGTACSVPSFPGDP